MQFNETYGSLNGLGDVVDGVSDGVGDLSDETLVWLVCVWY